MIVEPADSEVRRQEKLRLEGVIRDSREAALVVNTHSRRGRRLYSRAKELLEEKGFRLTASYPVKDPSRLPEIVETLVERGQKLIIVGGGDGTVSSVVDFLAYRDVALGVLPLGTANSFARTLGLPIEVADAVEVIAAGKVADVDLGQIGDDYFANSAALGISTDIGRSQPKRLKRYLGRFAYLLVGARRFVTHKAFRCRFTDGDRMREVSALDVLIANGPYHGGVLVADDADIESSDIVIRIIRGPSRWTLAREWIRIGIGKGFDPRDLEIIRTRDVMLEAEPRQYVSIDGEVVTQTPIRIRVAPEALRIMVPQSFKEQS
jgi:YegS/Rv2252/BmrU family lipid kinase